MPALLVVHCGVVWVLADEEQTAPRGDVDASHMPRTLPIRVDPLVEESLDSWWEALASRADASWGEILRAVGVVGARGNTASYWAARATVSLTPRQLSSVSQCTGVRPRRLRALTLQPWIDDTNFQRPSVARMRITGSRFCPRCLEERGGRWRVWWRLRWAFACPIHECLLADACSACGGAQRTAPPRAGEVPSLGSCTRSVSPSGQTRECDEPLSNVPIVRLGSGPALVQRQLLGLLAAGRVSSGVYAASPVPSTLFTRDLRALGEWMLRHARTGDATATAISNPLWEQFVLQGRRQFSRPMVTSAGTRVTCSSPASDAAVACIALPVLRAADIDSAIARLRSVTLSMRRRGLSLSVPRNIWGRGYSPPLDALRQRIVSGHGPRARSARPTVARA